MEPDAADSFRHFFRQATGQEQGPYPDQEKLATLDFPVRKRMNRRGIDERCLASAESAISNSRSFNERAPARQEIADRPGESGMVTCDPWVLVQ